jgi:hypothetical protein
VFSLIVGPKELAHEFLSHHDTEDVHCMDVCKEHFSERHQHCDVLQLTTPPLYLSVDNFSFSFTTLSCTYQVESTGGYQYNSSAFLFYRGPPLV